MRLDFSGLTQPTSSPPSQKHWGQVGTPGTPIAKRVTARSGNGDMAGTSGEMQPIMRACPQVSPVCPRPPTASKPNGHAVSPMSPVVPAFCKARSMAEGFDLEAFEERAAIMEFDGGMTRSEAEAAARSIIATASSSARRGNT